MSKEKQIEELARVIGDCSEIRPFNTCDECRNATGKYCCHIILATKLYNAGYRKQSEGEWVPSDIPQEKYVCSVCGGACWYYDFQGDVAKSRYCPNCGAKMKGGAE